MCTPTKPAAANSRPAPAMGAPVNPCRCSTGTEVIKVLATYIHQSCKASGQGWFQPSFWNQAVLGISSDFISASACGQLQSLHAQELVEAELHPLRSLENEAARTGPLPLPCLHNRTSYYGGLGLCSVHAPSCSLDHTLAPSSCFYVANFSPIPRSVCWSLGVTTSHCAHQQLLLSGCGMQWGGQDH